MNKSHRIFLIWAALFSGAAIPTAQRTLRSHASPTGTNSYFGRAVEGLGDVNGDGRDDYAISGNGINVAGNGAGQVRVFSGATGALLWSANGVGSWVPCGGGGTTGDFFGFDIERVPDVSGDGIDELAVGAPFAFRFNGSCNVPNFGRLTVLSGATGAVLQTSQGQAFDDFYGMSIKRVPDMLFDGIDEYLVRSSRYVNVIDGATGSLFVTWTLANGESAISGVGDFDGDGLSWEIAVGNPSADTVTIVNVLTGQTTVFTGPAGSQYGTALELGPTNAAGQGSVLVGAPGEASGTGAVYLIDQNGSTRLALGTPGSQLGSALAFGGSADLNGLPDDLLAGAPGGNFVRVMTSGGALIQDVVGTTAGSLGNAVDWIGMIVPNGFDEFLVGDAGFTNSTGNADVMFGGPAASLIQNFGPGCNPNGGAVPVLTQSTGLRPGGTYIMSVAGAPPFSTGILALGIASPTGIPLPPCTVWMSPTFGPFTLANIFTNFVGNWSSSTLSIPLDPNLIGLPIAHQAAIAQGPSILLTNATASTIGW